MKILRQVGDFKLNEGNLMASGLFNVSNDSEMAQAKTGGVSNWFCDEIRDELLSCNNRVFLIKAKTLIKLS